jgi:metastasis-associated protein MTA
MWKTTDRYVQQKRVKAVEAESKLKQVYIPNYNKTPASTTAPSTTIVPLGNSNSNSNGKPTSVLNGNSNGNMVTDNSGILMVGVGGKSCESCQVMQSPQWYAWGPPNMQCRVCQPCWTYWKKYGGLKVYTRKRERGFIKRKINDKVIDKISRNFSILTGTYTYR